MATRIRLKKVGRKKQASFRIVVAGGMHARGGRITETIGKYNPRTQPSYIEVDAGRALHWLREGAQMSESVNSLFRQAGILEKYAKGAEAEGVVVIGDPQGKTRLAGSAGAESEPDTAAAPPDKGAKAKPEAKAALAPDTVGEAGPAGSAPSPDTAGEAKPAEAPKAKAAKAEAAEANAAAADAAPSESEPQAAEGEAEAKQDAES